MKICKNCNEEKPLNEFPKNRIMKSGYRNECKKCTGEYMAAYRIEHLAELKAYKSNYRTENIFKIREDQNIYNKKNRDQINARQARYVKANPERHKASQARYKAKLALNIAEKPSKICPCCNEEKPIVRFQKNSEFPSGRCVFCKTCQAKLTKKV